MKSIVTRKMNALIILPFLLLGFLPKSFGSVEIGATCSKLGQTQISKGFKYTCTKSGKKLIWKITAIVKETSKTNNQTVYPTDLTTITQRAYTDFINLYKSRATNEVPNIKYIVAPNTDPSFLKQIVDNVNATAKFFNLERPITEPLNVWVAMSTNFKWIYENMNSVLSPQQLDGGWLDSKLAKSEEQCGFQGGGAPGDGKDGNAVLFFNIGCNSSWGNSVWSQVPGHEYAHVAQRYELGGTMAPMLCWVREGNANYYGWLMAGRNSQAAYRNFWLQAISLISSAGELPDYQSKSADYWTNFFVRSESLTPTQCDPWINYIMGAMAFQYLAGTYGNQAISNFYLGLKDGWKGVCDSQLNNQGIPCQSWKKVFAKVFGVTPEATYPKFGNYIAGEIKWAEEKKILWGQDALAIAPIPTN